MNVALWIVAGALALVFAMAGSMKLSKPRKSLEAQMGWVADASDGQVKAIGALEVLGAIGLIAPAAADVAPILVAVAAAGLAVLMAGAAIVHLRRRDSIVNVVPPLVLGVLAIVVAVGRFGPQAF